MLLSPLLSKPPPRGNPPAQSQRLSCLALKGAVEYLFTNEMAAHCWSEPAYFSGRKDRIVALDGGPAFRFRAWAKASARVALENGRLVERVPDVFIVGLPEAPYRLDQDNGGGATKLFEIELARFYREELDGRREAVFLFVPHGGDPDVVFFWAGAAIFIGGDGEQPVERLSVSLIGPDGREQALPDPLWLTRKLVGNELVPDSRPAGRYRRQRWLLFGGDYGQAAIVLTKWIGGGTAGWALIDLDAQGEAAHGCGDGTVLESRGRRTVDEATGARRWTFTAAQAADRPGDRPERLVVTLTPLPGPPVPKPTVEPVVTPAPPPKRSPCATDAEGHGAVTLPHPVPGPESVAQEPPGGFLDIAALELPCLAGRFGLPGVEDWLLRFDATGRMADGAGDDRLRLGSRSADGTLFAGLPGEKRWIAVAVTDGPVDLPLAGGGTLSIHPPVRPAGSFGLLRLRRPLPVALPAGRSLVIGRHGGGVPAPGRIVFGLLDRPGSLTVAGDPTATLEQVGLSRRHLRARIIDGRLHLNAFAGRTAVWRLDPGGAATGVLTPGGDGTLVLEPGDGLLIGGYLTRFRPVAR